MLMISPSTHGHLYALFAWPNDFGHGWQKFPWGQEPWGVFLFGKDMRMILCLIAYSGKGRGRFLPNYLFREGMGMWWNPHPLSIFPFLYFNFLFF